MKRASNTGESGTGVTPISGIRRLRARVGMSVKTSSFSPSALIDETEASQDPEINGRNKKEVNNI